jgi:hypothetical protein
MSCPFAGMTRIRFKGSPRFLQSKNWRSLSSCRNSPRNTVNVCAIWGVSTRPRGARAWPPFAQSRYGPGSLLTATFTVPSTSAITRKVRES